MWCMLCGLPHVFEMCCTLCRHTIQHTGFLYISFKPKMYYWDSLIYSRKAAFAMAGALLQSNGSADLQCSVSTRPLEL